MGLQISHVTPTQDFRRQANRYIIFITCIIKIPYKNKKLLQKKCTLHVDDVNEQKMRVVCRNITI